MIRSVIIEGGATYMQLDVGDYDGSMMVAVAWWPRSSRTAVDRRMFDVKRLGNEDAHWNDFLALAKHVAPDCASDAVHAMAAICGFRLLQEDNDDGKTRTGIETSAPGDGSPES